MTDRAGDAPVSAAPLDGDAATERSEAFASAVEQARESRTVTRLAAELLDYDVQWLVFSIAAKKAGFPGMATESAATATERDWYAPQMVRDWTERRRLLWTLRASNPAAFLLEFNCAWPR